MKPIQSESSSPVERSLSVESSFAEAELSPGGALLYNLLFGGYFLRVERSFECSGISCRNESCKASKFLGKRRFKEPLLTKTHTVIREKILAS